MQITPPHLGGHMDITHIDEGVLDALIERYHIRSVIDIGCGPGGMVKLALKKGLRAVGVDGDPRVRELSGLGQDSLIIHDFAQGPLPVEEQFDLAWSVEFLEHVDEIYQSNYMSAFKKAKFAFCTAAPPGKGGYHHVNCRDIEYWREIFRVHHLLYDNGTTRLLRNASSMPREFVRETGMLFVLDEDGPMAAFVRNTQAPLPGLTSSLGDIELLANRFPPGLAYQGFEGDFAEINWPPR